jgi:hypothetical protein
MNDERIDSYIWNLHQQNLSQGKIAGILNVDREKICAIIEAYVNNTKLIHQMEPSRKITSEIKSKICDLTFDKGSLSNISIATITKEQFGVDISRFPSNAIQHELHFYFKHPKICQLLNEDQIIARLQLTEYYFNGYLPKGPLVFSDESRFCKGGDKKWVWRSRGSYASSIFQEREKFPKISIMCWGSIGLNYESLLIIFNENVDANIYQTKLLESRFIQSADITFGHMKWFFVQDGTSCHTTLATINAITAHCNIFLSGPKLM